jgi:hypothetical protein
MAQVRAPGLGLGTDNIQKATAAAGEMGEFVWAVAAEKGPSLQINREPAISCFQGRFTVGAPKPSEYGSGLQVDMVPGR